MNLQTAFVTCRSKYAVFSGRASRSEFWWFQLAVFGLCFGASLVSYRAGPPLSDYGPLIFNLIILSPTLAVGSRRLHDVGRSGWWQLLTITVVGVLLLVYWWVQPSQPGSNQYGDEPEADKGIATAAAPSPFVQPSTSDSTVFAANHSPLTQGSKTAAVPEARKGMLDWTQRGKDA
ncbi:DUF805 domain-containing protein [Xanthobacter aminoxidans]|uniref:DUF805 domain-containing protein n=1 Tax=Xanthobacter aminoxidans TaxID=186280 RepID=UPI00372A3015